MGQAKMGGTAGGARRAGGKGAQGAACVIAAGFFWGYTGACAQYLFVRYGTDPLWLTSLRMIVAGLLLVAYGAATDRKAMVAIWRNRSDAAMTVFVGIFGLMLSQYAYLAAIGHSNAGTTTAIQFLFPVYIMLHVCVSSRRLPSGTELLSVLLALCGTFALATHGDFGGMQITGRALVWSLLSGIAVAIYSIFPKGILEKYGSVPVTGYGMLIGGVALCVAGRAWNAQVQLDWAGIAAVSSIVLIGTALAQTLYMRGLSIVGPSRASMLISVQLFAATFFAMAWLKTRFEAFDMLGFAFILAMFFLLARKGPALYSNCE
ncbi:MAG: DMT family transporter [Clostridiales Family XIII bacterium]|nr:DMT family transporter [Clostridiales Family XIII bacterium]